MSSATQQPNLETSVTQSSPEATPKAEALGRAVGGGMSWMVVSTALTRAVTFLAQILLGWWLNPKDFALYATATSVAGFMMVCRDMATGNLLVQRGRERYNECAGAAFWLAFTYNLGVALLTTAVAFPLASKVYHEPDLAPMLLVMGWAIPIGAIGNNLFAKLRIDLRFKAFSMQMAWSGTVRQIAMVVLAKMGFGPMSFAWPVLAYTLFDAVTLWMLTHDAPWKRPFQFDQWPGLIRQAVWLMVNSLANFAMDFGPFLVLGPMLVKTLRTGGAGDAEAAAKAAYDITGYYFFAYQITAQIGVMLAFNATMVLVPALQRMAREPERQRDAALRALRTLMLAGSIASLGLAAVMGPLEHLLWGGKYALSVAAILIFGAFYPWRITFGLCTSVLMAQGAFRRLAVLSAFECLGLMAAAATAAVTSPSPSGIAWWTGSWVMFSRVVATCYVFYKMGGSAWATVKSMFPAWIVSLAAFGIAMLVDSRVGLHGLLAGNTTMNNLVRSVVGEGHRVIWVSRAADVAQICVTGAICGAAFVLVARVLLADDLRDALRVAPGPIRTRMTRLLKLGEPAAA